jgi:hypothetical protein
MKHEFEKRMRIACDLLAYCHHIGAKEFRLDMKEGEGSVLFSVEARPANVSEERMERLRNKLGAPRHRETEQEYWHLMGESEDFSELTLVGMMSDEFTAEYDGDVISITINRHD